MIKDHENGIIYRIDALRKKKTEKYIYYENDKQKTYE